jgi:hypothetical protein
MHSLELPQGKQRKKENDLLAWVGAQRSSFETSIFNPADFLAGKPSFQLQVNRYSIEFTLRDTPFFCGEY